MRMSPGAAAAMAGGTSVKSAPPESSTVMVPAAADATRSSAALADRTTQRHADELDACMRVSRRAPAGYRGLHGLPIVEPRRVTVDDGTPGLKRRLNLLALGAVVVLVVLARACGLSTAAPPRSEAALPADRSASEAPDAAAGAP